MSQTNLSGVEETPLFIGFKDFPDRETCMTHAVENKHNYFAKAISEYGNKLRPNVLNCISEKIVQQIGKEVGKIQNEKSI
tara:strand:- start:289 stop:528 length:240 start_codon:yes stop_codon:yes gene_type:complete